jgi:hypothetical protein
MAEEKKNFFFFFFLTRPTRRWRGHIARRLRRPPPNSFTQHVLFYLWRDTTSELWTPILFPSYSYHLFTLLALFTLLTYFYCFPLDTLITFVSSKPVRLTTSS